MGKNINAADDTVREVVGERRRNVKHLNKTESNSNKSDKNIHAKTKNKIDARNGKPVWPRKEFGLHTSYLTEAWKNLDLRGIRHLCYVVWIMWIMRLIILDYTSNKPFNIPGVPTILIAFQSFHYWVMSHFVFLISALIVNIGFQSWAWSRSRTIVRGPFRKMLDGLSAGIMIAYMSVLIFVPWWWILIVPHLGVFTKEFMVGEQVRICMKIIAFLAEKIPQTLDDRAKYVEAKNKNDPRTKSSAGISQFIYFLYAPTLIYRDEYPRNDRIRWSFVLEHIMELALILYTGFVVYETEAQPAVASYFSARRPESYALLILQNSLPFFVLLVLGIIGLWHDMQNIFAEMLRFGDRRFHFDWWNEGTPAGFHRSNNIVVQDWLFYYVYNPVKKHTGSRSAAQLTVLLLSGAVHDVMLAVAIGFGSPIIVSHFIMIAIVLQLSKNDKSRDALSNFMHLVFFPSGASFIGCFLAVEYHARQQCPRLIESSWDFFYPRFIDCRLLS